MKNGTHFDTQVVHRFRAIRVDTEHPLAIDSPDHLFPKGTRFDLSRNAHFSEKVRRLFHSVCAQIRVLDLGCSGGSFVEEWVQSGHFAIGLEGSDYSKIYRRAAWGSIPQFLFTCDVVYPFRVVLETDAGDQPLHFHLITAWELLEHLKQEQLVGLLDNVSKHLEPTGLFIASISPKEAFSHAGVALHQTVRPESWWEEFLREHGFIRRREIELFFGGHYVRGGRRERRSKDGSFNVVLSRSDYPSRPLPRQRIGHRLSDRWFDSRLQRFLRWAVVGDKV